MNLRYHHSIVLRRTKSSSNIQSFDSPSLSRSIVAELIKHEFPPMLRSFERSSMMIIKRQREKRENLQ